MANENPQPPDGSKSRLPKGFSLLQGRSLVVEKTGESSVISRERKRVLLACAAVLLVTGFSAWHLSAWPIRLCYPGEVHPIEGIAVREMQHLRQGVPIYAPASSHRFDSGIYGPLYYLLGARLIDPGNPTYLSLRLVSTLATLGCAAGCALLAFWLSGRWLAAVLAPLMFLGYGFVTFHGISARSDIVALALCFWAFLVAYRLRSTRAVLLPVPLMLMGLYYKPQFVGGTLAVFFFLLLEKRFRMALGFGGLLALGALGMLALFQYAVFPGQSFLLHVTTYNLLPFSWNRFGFGALIFAVIFIVPLLVSLEFLRQHPNKLLCCYLGCTVLVAVTQIAKEGSGTNYFLECILVLSPLFAALLAQRIREGSAVGELVVLLGVAVLAGQRLGAFDPVPEDFVKDRVVQDFLRRNFPPGTIALGHFTGDLMRAGLDTPISDFYQYSWLVCQGTLSDRDLLTQLEQHRFGVLLLTVDLRDERHAHTPNNICLTERLHRTMLQNYRLTAILEAPGPEKTDAPDLRLYLWVPRTGHDHTPLDTLSAPGSHSPMGRENRDWGSGHCWDRDPPSQVAR
jgi:hypothetical protein